MNRKLPKVLLRPVLPGLDISPQTIAIQKSQSSQPLKSGIPFFKTPAHTIPTRWGLYRSLLRSTTFIPISTNTDQQGDDSPAVEGRSPSVSDGDQSGGKALTGAQSLKLDFGDDFVGLKRSIREQWRKRRPWTSPINTKQWLETQYELLGLLNKARTCDQDALRRIKKENRRLISLFRWRDGRDQSRQEGNRPQPPKPYLTGTPHRPTLFNPPLPRQKPQPLSVSMMINKRRKHRERLREERIVLGGWLGEMQAEVKFWRSLDIDGSAVVGRAKGQGEGVEGSGEEKTTWDGGWDYHLKSHLRSIDQSLDRDHRRSNLVFTPGMMERIERARLKRISGLHERGRKRRRRMSGADTLTPTSTALSPTQAAFGVPKPSYEPASSDPPSPT